jgi:hypothetical protein
MSQATHARSLVIHLYFQPTTAHWHSIPEVRLQEAVPPSTAPRDSPAPHAQTSVFPVRNASVLR